jgi:GTP pyrophosphokinase
MSAAPSIVTERMVAAIDRAGVPFDRERLGLALRTIQELYAGQTHWSGETLLEHIAGVLDVLLPFQPDEDAVVACLLHHVLSMEGGSLTDIEQQFGQKVRSLVSGVHLLSHVSVQGRRRPIEDLRVMLLSVSDDIRTIFITLCDRCHLMDIIDRLTPEEQRRVSQDALQLFAPVAARLGIYSIKHRMETRGFPVLYPSDAQRIQEQTDRLHAQHGDFLPEVMTAVAKELSTHGVTPVQVTAREKQPYSIFGKMRQKSISDLKDVYDFYACRIVVQNIEQCYQALGIVHQLGRPMSQRFKDYISFPKPNGYQSLHTSVAQLPGAPDDVRIEVQVRTEAMNREAEFGVAAHWSYKAHGSTVRAMEQVQLHRMIESQSVLEEGHEGVPRLADHIFVLSPKGDIIELPEGATPLDFAFQVHTELGLSFRGARVNGVLVPIDHELENGDVIEILRQGAPHPSPQWFQHLKLSSARSKLRRYLYQQDRPALVAQGKALVNELLRKYHLPPLDQEYRALRECDGQTLSFQEREDLLMKIGQGSERVASLTERAAVFRDVVHDHFVPEAAAAELKPEQRTVEMTDGVPMPTRYAKCCKPHEKEFPPIVGVVSRTGTVIIHKRGCGMLRNANPERQVGVRWKLPKA